MHTAPLQAFLIDDEALAIERLKRLLGGFAGIEVAGSATDPAQAVHILNEEFKQRIDILFLDIQMPGMTGFELLSKLAVQPFVIFTTAYDEYALRAFEVNSIDYLLKPIEKAELARAIKKLDRLHPAARPNWLQSPDLSNLLAELGASIRDKAPEYPRRIASRVGERISFLDLSAVTHFIAHDKLTYAVIDGHRHVVDQSIAELERRLDPSRFLRVHRAGLVNIDWIQEVNSWFAGRVVLSLKDPPRTQIPVARDRVRFLKSRMGF